AEYAARHFLALTEYAWNTGDTQPMKDFSSPECQLCSAMAQSIDDLYISGGWANGQKYVVHKVVRDEPVNQEEITSTTYGVQLKISSPETHIYRNGVLEKNPPGNELLALFIVWDGEGWHISQAASEEESNESSNP
ncbi:DUF6318 family protein, partial [Actinomyces sp. B33]|uniref:DUF6318 family protein n=1 Tax=Actinomyces sp. B33 TaxID=2942131 RepID=UPI0023409510